MATPEEIDNYRALLFGQDGGGSFRSGVPGDAFVALVIVVTREINILRDLHGLPARTQAQVVTALRDSMNDLTVE